MEKYAGLVATLVCCRTCGRSLAILVSPSEVATVGKSWQCPVCQRSEDRSRTARLDRALDQIADGEVPPAVLSRVLEDLRSLRTVTS